MQSIYKLWTNTAASDGAASLDIVSDGKITGYWWVVEADLDADGEAASAQLSFASTSAFSTNDTKSPITEVRLRNGLLTSGAVLAAYNGGVAGLSIPVSQGERLYLHTGGTPGVTAAVCYVYVEDKQKTTGRRVRA